MAKILEVFIKINDEIKYFQDKGLSFNASRRLAHEKYKNEKGEK